MAQIGSLSVKLGLVTVEWDKATDKAKQQAKDLQKSFNDLGDGLSSMKDKWKSLGGSLSIGAVGLAGLIQQSIALTDELSDTAKGFGITVSQIYTFRDALMGAGVSADGAGKIMSTLFTKITEGTKGGDLILGQFQRLGISFSDLKTLTPYDAIVKVAKGFEQVSSSIEKVKLIKEFFGKAGIGMDINSINEALAKGTSANDEYAKSIEQMGVIGDNMKRSLANLTIAFTDLVSGFARDKITGIETFKALLVSIGSAAVIAGVGSLVIQIIAVAKAIEGVTLASVAFNTIAGIGTPAGLILKAVGIAAAVGSYLYMMGKAEDAAAEKGRSVSGLVTPMAGSTPDQPKLLSNEAASLQIQINLQNQLAILEMKKLTIAGQNMEMGASLTKIKTEEVSLSEKIAQIEAKRKAELIKSKEGTEEMRGAINALADSEISRAKNTTKQNIENVKNLEEQLLLLNQIANSQDIRRTEARDYGAAKDAAQSLLESEIATRYEAGKTADEQVRLEDLANQRLEFEQSILTAMPIEQKYLQDKFDLEAKITEFKFQQKKLGVDPEITARRIDEMKKVGDATADLNKQTLDYQRTFEYGWDQAYRSYVDGATNSAKTAGDMFNSITTNMNTALDNFVKTGKLNFSDLAKSIIQSLISIQMQAQLTNILGLGKTAMGGGSGLSGLAGLLGFGGLSSSSTSMLGEMAAAGPVMGFASGGEPPLNQVSMVGENGPELFIPKSSGTIIPNGALSGLGGGGGQTINYNGPFIQSMSAIDTQSGLQFLAKNKQSVWSAYQSANRGIPMSR